MKFGLRRLCLTLLAASLLLPGPAAASPAPVPGNLKLERVVMLFRHGIRAPLNGEAGAANLATQPWQHWAMPASYLTPHGIAALRLVGIYDREMFAAEGLLPAQGCPATGSVSIWTNSIERTIASGAARA